MSIEVVENRFVTYTDWSGYLKYLDAVGDGRTRVTYDRGTLELMSPSNEHEQVKSILGRIVETVMVEALIDFTFGGSTTFRREDLDRGLDPDECYWIANWGSFLGRPYDVDSDPPPDLVVEVDIYSSSINRLELYRVMRVPEVWRYCRDRIMRIYQLQDGKYVVCSHSPTIPKLASVDLDRILSKRSEMSSSALLRYVRDWWRSVE